MAFDPSKPLSEQDAHDLCEETVIDLDLLALLGIEVFGVKLEIEPPITADLAGLAGKLLGKANAVLAPLAPIFDLIEILILLKDVLEAVASLNPYKILQALKKFEKLLKKLIKYVPQLSVPRLIKGLVGVLIAFLVGLRAELLAVILEIGRIDIAKAKAAKLGDVTLLAAIECAEVNAAASLTLVTQSAEPLNRLLVSINFLASLVPGVPEIPALSFDPNGSASDALAPIDKLIDTLRTIQKAIPV